MAGARSRGNGGQNRFAIGQERALIASLRRAGPEHQSCRQIGGEPPIFGVELRGNLGQRMGEQIQLGRRAARRQQFPAIHRVEQHIPGRLPHRRAIGTERLGQHRQARLAERGHSLEMILDERIGNLRQFLPKA